MWYPCIYLYLGKNFLWWHIKTDCSHVNFGKFVSTWQSPKETRTHRSIGFQTSKTENNCTFVFWYDFVTHTKSLILRLRLVILMTHTVWAILTDRQCCNDKRIWHGNEAWFHRIFLDWLRLLGNWLTIIWLTRWSWLARTFLVWHFWLGFGRPTVCHILIIYYGKI